MVDAPRADVAIWTDALAVPRIERVLELMEGMVEPVAIGGPRAGRIDELAGKLRCPHEDDLRKLLVDRPARFVLLTSMDGVRASDVQVATAQGSVVLTWEPVAAELSESLAFKPRSGTPGGSDRGRVLWTPAFERSPGWIGAIQPDHALGRAELIHFESYGQQADCSLFARLFDAWRVVLAAGQPPETVDASLTGPLGNVPENLRGITGHLAAHARLADGCAAVLSLSDRAARSGRVVNIVSGQGHTRVTDGGYQIFSDEGSCVDHGAQPDEPPCFEQLMAADWKNLIRRDSRGVTVSVPPSEPTQTMVMACCVACLLSARTGQSESPGKLLQLHHC